MKGAPKRNLEAKLLMKAPNDLSHTCSGRFITLSVGFSALLAANQSILVTESKADTLDDFNSSALSQDWQKRNEEVGQIAIIADRLFISADPSPNNVVWIKNLAHPYTIEDGRTLEFSVDVIDANQHGATAGLSFTIDGYAGDTHGYAIYVDADTLLLVKSNQQAFKIVNGQFPRNNVRMVLRMTGSGSDVIIVAQVLDLQDGSVLFERAVRDTAGIDPMDFGTDSPPASYLGKIGRFDLTLWQRPEGDSTGGGMDSEVIFDNACVAQYVSIGIERAVLLTWRDPGALYAVVGAMSIDGPWEVINEPIIENGETGLQQMTVSVPLSNRMEFFRIVELEE